MNKKNRSGTSRNDKKLHALNPASVSVEERSLVELLHYVREYAKKVRFYNSDNEADGFWTSFLAFEDDELLDMAQFVNNPELLQENPNRFSKYTKPHLALLLVFLKLLDYPKRSFAKLTGKNLEHFYRNVLQLKEQEEVPDEVHVIVKLARDVNEHLLKKGTLLYAGKDETGTDVHYEVESDVVLNNAQITDIKTIHFNKSTSDIKAVHLHHRQGDAGFEKILCLVLGGIEHLPVYRTSLGNTIDVDAVYLRTDLYKRVKNKERDELEADDAAYIFDTLCFTYLKDFQYCLDIFYREINRGYAGVTYPEDIEWEKVYQILEDVHVERISRSRRAMLKHMHNEYGFESMMEFAFGEPDPWNMLYKMPESVEELALEQDIDLLEALAVADNEASRIYIETKLCMRSDDFAMIMDKKDDSLVSIYGDEVYTILEQAWTKKRDFRYPIIGTETIEGFYADTIYNAADDEKIERFKAFGKSSTADSSENITMGFAVGSPLLRLNEGRRDIELVISCKEGTIDYEKIGTLLDENTDLFTTSLSVKDGFKTVDNVEFDIGKFIIKPALKTYSRKHTELYCDIKKHYFFESRHAGYYLIFPGKGMYRIKSVDTDANELALQSVHLPYTADNPRLITSLIPDIFMDELAAEIAIEPGEHIAVSDVEVFNDYYEGNYIVDKTGNIFLMTRFISADSAEVRYCGALPRDAADQLSDESNLMLNKVWEDIRIEYADAETQAEIVGLDITGIHSSEKAIDFVVTADRIRIIYPEGTTTDQVIAAWKKWNDNPFNNRYNFELSGNGTQAVSPASRKIMNTGEVIKRYEAVEETGLRITYRGGPADKADIIIEEQSLLHDETRFVISGGIATITPGRESHTANKIAADWLIWIEDANNDPAGFHIESKDERLWNATPLDPEHLVEQDKIIRVSDLTNYYGNGIRIKHTGTTVDQPKVIVKEHTIDCFEFDVDESDILTISYPPERETSGYDLVTAWNNWKNSVINDPGMFDIEQLGDGHWVVTSNAEHELKFAENQIMECEISDAGIIAMYKLTGDYENAIIEFVESTTATGFDFAFSDPTGKPKKTKQLTITYPQHNTGITPEKYVQKMLQAWNKEHSKNGFALIKSDDPTWKFTSGSETGYDFFENLNYVCTVHPDGFKVKYKPTGIQASTSVDQLPKVTLVIRENSTHDFTFTAVDDNGDDKILFINYPTDKDARTVENLITAWDAIMKTGTPSPELSSFSLQSAGTGKWKITGTTELRFPDTFDQEFFEYKTSDVDGFTVYYTGPGGAAPMITMEDHDGDTYLVNLINNNETLSIKYPARKDKQTIVDLLKVWGEYKKAHADTFIGFTLVDTSATVTKRSQAPLLMTGDRIGEYKAGSGLCVTHIGRRDEVRAELEPIVDFKHDDVDKKIIFDNGRIFTITEKVNNTTVLLEHTGMIERYDGVELYDPDVICLNALKFRLSLDADFPALMPVADEVSSPYPVIKIVLDTTKTYNHLEGEAIFYEYFKSICMERVDINVAVSGVKQISMHGDIARINPANPFYPFGLTPEKSARFYFANREICEKPLDSLQVNFTWDQSGIMTDEGLPDMERHYYAYSHYGVDHVGTIANDDFDVSLKFLDNRTWVCIGEEPQCLMSHGVLYDDLSAQTYRGDLFEPDDALPDDPLNWPRYYKMELSNHGFMRGLYTDLINESSRAINAYTAARIEYDMIKKEIKSREKRVKAEMTAETEAPAGTYVPEAIPQARSLPDLPENDYDISKLTLHEPYSPLLQSMSIDYSASGRIDLGAMTMSDDTFDVPAVLLRYHPFGYETMGTVGDDDDYLLPQYDDQGYLMIGIKDAAPLQNISLLIQMVSGSGDANSAIPSVSWNYLSENKWVDFKDSQILVDMTAGLQDTGVIRFTLPGDATMNNTVLPGDRFWIRAKVAENTKAVPDILDIRTGAIRVTYRNNGNDPAYLDTPLSAGAIQKLAQRDAAVKEVVQPYSSFKGKCAEKSDDYFIRVSERLKHKQRALTLDDYEKMILTQFPEIYKVKCVPQNELDLLNPTDETEVVIIVILKNLNTAPFFPLKPKTPATILGEIKTYIEAYMPPLVRVTVRNPRFEEIKYRMAVKFTKGYDQGFYINQLNEDIKRFLSPWAYDKEAAVSFGSAVYSSSVINHIENQAYIDYVANFTLLHQVITHEDYTEVVPLFLTEDNAAFTRYPDSLLVSADEHIIDVITTDIYDPGAFRGIGHMKIGLDFWISRPGPIFAVGIGEMEVQGLPVLRYIFSEIPVTINVNVQLPDGTPVTKEFDTHITREFSNTIRNTLIENGYVDAKGNVISTNDLYNDEFEFVVTGYPSFEAYLTDNTVLDNFDVDLMLKDFDPADTTGDYIEESAIRSIELLDKPNFEQKILAYLILGQGFDGWSQYPYLVY